MDDVVAFFTHQEVGLTDVSARIRNDVVAFTAMDLVDTIAGFNAVIALTTPDRVVTATGNDRVIPVGALDQGVVQAVELKEIGTPLHHGRQRILEGVTADGVGADPFCVL